MLITFLVMALAVGFAAAYGLSFGVLVAICGIAAWALWRWWAGVCSTGKRGNRTMCCSTRACRCHSRGCWSYLRHGHPGHGVMHVLRARHPRGAGLRLPLVKVMLLVIIKTAVSLTPVGSTPVRYC
jgi:hypothetical protein